MQIQLINNRTHRYGAIIYGEMEKRWRI